ncbi:MAG: 4-(cytidine 5'-diphospho)-2-C-methyl-D-erythritol kinase [Deltaproteobacteria bacterium]|nr:4-(cytidine 5'-diphospho)-2-C-methyl-D-erythritol kinase [Deltaproteobacteria bacterium]
MSQKIKISAPAKINLRLKITGRRSDGYHLLDMVMVKLDLCDEIDFEIEKKSPHAPLCQRGETPPLVGGDFQIPLDSSNTLWKVAQLVREESGQKFELKISLNKNIPIAAGLGGGSSDAAALLIALNRELGLDWSRERLMKICLKIGADVPFFLAEGPQRVTGIGEILEPISVPSLSVILINPGFSVSTKEVYHWFDLEIVETGDSGRAPARAQRVSTGGRNPRQDPPLVALTEVGIDAIPPLLENDLEKVVFSRYPVLAEMKEMLMKAGALGALMSGSGGTVFGLFESAASRDRGFDLMVQKKNPEWWVWKGRSL